MELSLVYRALRRWWWLILAFAVIAGGTVAGLAASQPPMYTATAQGMVSVSDPANRPPYALSSGAGYILDRMTSYAVLGVTTPVLTPVVDQLALEETPLSLSGRISSHSVVGKAVLEVSVTYNDPRTAAAIADAVLAQTGKSIAGLEHGNVTLTPLGAALPPTSPSNGNTGLNSALAAVGGVIAGAFLAVALQFFFERRRRE